MSNSCSEETPEEAMTGLKSIWEDEHVTRLPIVQGGQRQWKCMWCKNTFNQWNSTKAIYHLNRIKGYSIKPCSSEEIDMESQHRYACLMVSLEVKRKRISEKRVADLDDNLDNGNKDSPSTTALPSVGSVWKDTNVLKIQNKQGEKSWQCLWCNQHFSQWNATKAIHHLNRRKGCDIKPCTGEIMDESCKRRYTDLMIAVEAKRRKKHKKLQGNFDQEDSDDPATTAVSGNGMDSFVPESLTKHSIADIWDDDHVYRNRTATGEKFWECLWCDQSFSQWNATQAINHVNQRACGDMQLCSSTSIDEEHKHKYQALMALVDSQSEQMPELKSVDEAENIVAQETPLEELNTGANEKGPDNKRTLPISGSNENDSNRNKPSKQPRISSKQVSPDVQRVKPSNGTLNSIWDDGHVIKTRKPTGEKCWECLWCQRQFSQWNATKAIYHVNQFRGNDIHPCTSRNIDKEHKRQYRGLMEALRNKRRKQKLQRKGKDVFSSFVEKIVEQHDEEVANNLINILGDRL